MAAEETWPRSQWCSRLGPQQRALSCCRSRQGRASIPTLPFCPVATWYLALPHKTGLVKAFQLREHVWKNIVITEVFMFSGKGAKLELPRQEVSFCFIVVTEAEGQTD